MGRIRRVILVLLALGMLTACTPKANRSAQVPSDMIRYLASFYPVYLAADAVAGEIPGVSIALLTGPQAGLLSQYVLSEPDFEAISLSGAFVCMGGGLESFLDGVIGAEICPVAVLADSIDRMPGAEEADNPYVWLAPGNWMQILSGAASAFAAMDAEHADAYAENLAQALLDVSASRLALAEAKLTGRRAVILHPAAAYLAREAGMEITLTILRDPGYQPGPGDLEDLTDLLAGQEGALALIEREAPESLLTAIRQSGLTPVLLDTLCAGTEADAPNAWDKAFESNLAALKAANAT